MKGCVKEDKKSSLSNQIRTMNSIAIVSSFLRQRKISSCDCDDCDPCDCSLCDCNSQQEGRSARRVSFPAFQLRGEFSMDFHLVKGSLQCV